MQPAADPYHEIVYPCGVPAHLHPSRIAPIAALYGLSAPDPSTARVLEIGCGDGINLLALAAAFPNGTYTGLDLSRSAIQQARANASACGLANLSFLESDITHADLQGPFDYILCHGVYSWVPPEARQGILATLARTLSPSGLAVVTFNALPGWSLRQPVRDTLLHHVAHLTDPTQRLAKARDLAAFLARAIPDEQADSSALRLEFEALGRKDPRVVWHDELAPVHRAFHLHEFLQDADAHGLAFVSDTEPADALLHTLPSTIAQELRARARSRLDREGLVDAVMPRRFHQCILARNHHQVLSAPDITRLRSILVSCGLPRLLASGPIHEPGTARFECPDGPSFSTDFSPGKIALHALAQRNPEPLSLEEITSLVLQHHLTTAPPAIRGGLLEFFFRISARGFIHWHSAVSAWTRTPGPTPIAHPPARLQLASGTETHSIHHRLVVLSDPWIRQLVTLCDGSRTHEALIGELRARVTAAGQTDAPDWLAIQRDLPGILRQLAALGLFTA